MTLSGAGLGEGGKKVKTLDFTGLSPLRARVVRSLVELILREGRATGSRLSEAELARELGVSRSPVGFALGFLARAGFLEQVPNHGYFLTAAPSAFAGLLPELGERGLYEALVEARISGDLPDELSEAELMRRFDTARGRLLGVLSRIRAEGWIERKPGHGWRFLPLIDTPEAYVESYVFRAAIEVAGLGLPGFAAVPARLGELREAQKAIRDGGFLTMSARGLFEANADFHESIAAWSGNCFILDALSRIDGLRRLVEYRHAQGDRSPRREQAIEHLAILDAIEAGELGAAAELLARHLEEARIAKTGG